MRGVVAGDLPPILKCDLFILDRDRPKASSAESVGGFRFWQSSKRVIEGHFHRFIGAKSVRTSGHHTDFVVETLDGAAGNLPFGAEPVQQQFLMRT